MTSLQYAAGTELLPARTEELNNAIRAARAAAELLGRLTYAAGAAEQTVAVGQVTVETGGQAIVGNVNSEARRCSKPERRRRTRATTHRAKSNKHAAVGPLNWFSVHISETRRPCWASPGCGARTRSGYALPVACRSGQKKRCGCMAVRRAPAHRGATKMRSTSAVRSLASGWATAQPLFGDAHSFSWCDSKYTPTTQYFVVAAAHTECWGC